MALTEGMSGPQAYMRSLSRWRPVEIAFWLALLLPYLIFPHYLSLASQIAVAALFALSLDLILGYAGLVSLGHAAFFGTGACWRACSALPSASSSRVSAISP
jgi:branched-chain amino acid transport system permease protein